MMSSPRTFEALGRTWSLRFDFGSIRRVAERTGFNPLAFSPDYQARVNSIVQDPMALHAVLCALLAPGLATIDGGEDKLGDALIDHGTQCKATAAFLEAFSDFLLARLGSRAQEAVVALAEAAQQMRGILPQSATA